MCHGEDIGLDHIRELLFGCRSSRVVLVVSDLVSDLEMLVVSAVELTGPNLRLGLMVLLMGASPQSISYICSVPGLAGALRLIVGHGWVRLKACF